VCLFKDASNTPLRVSTLPRIDNYAIIDSFVHPSERLAKSQEFDYITITESGNGSKGMITEVKLVNKAFE